MKSNLITAICTPLRDDEQLHVEGLEAHITDQWDAGISGLLVGGTMGLMQLLGDETYRDLIRYAAQFSRGRGEVLIGVGDTSYTRTRDRIEIAQRAPIDGLVVLTPYLVKFSQCDLVEYYRALASEASKPIYVYVLPALTGVSLDLSTALALSEVPNIHGMKCSVPLDWTRQLADRVSKDFRVIPAQPHMIDAVIRCGLLENLDGIFGVFPRLAVGVSYAAQTGDWNQAAQLQQQLSALLQLLTTSYPLFPACTALFNSRGIGGSVAPRPLRPMTQEMQERLLAEPLVTEALARESRYEGRKAVQAATR